MNENNQLQKETLKQIDSIKKCKDFSDFYFVLAITDSNYRFYSDTIYNLEESMEIFNSFIDQMNYFRGGRVLLYQITENDFDVISYTRV